MPYFLGFDAGGTKSRAVLFDEDGPLSEGISGGTNTNFISRETCRANIRACLDQALAGQPEIERVYAVIVGPAEVLKEELSARTGVKEIVHLGEGQAGLLAGALRKSGLVAMSGTGSDAFYVAPDGRTAVVGGYGSVLGDDGSGVWIGQNAIRRAIAYGEGWGEPTAFREILYQAWALRKRFDIVKAVHSDPAPYRKLAFAVPLVAQAARAGDAVALQLFREAGRLMARQMLALIRREEIDESARVCVCSGGTWKAHPAMYEAFCEAMAEGAPEIRIKKPLYEPVIAGAVLEGVRLEPFEEYRVEWGKD